MACQRTTVLSLEVRGSYETCTLSHYRLSLCAAEDVSEFTAGLRRHFCGVNSSCYPILKYTLMFKYQERDLKDAVALLRVKSFFVDHCVAFADC